MNHIEAMKQALEALEKGTGWMEHQEVITSLRQAIAKSEKPTNCRHCGGDANTICAGQCKTKEQEPVELDASAPIVMTPHPAFAPQRQWVGLTEKEILECRSANHLYFYKSIEAKLKEKNT